MIERKSQIDQTEINFRSGIVQVRIALMLVDGDEVLDTKWHRTSVATRELTEPQFAAVNEHLTQMGWPPVPEADIAKVVALQGTMAGE